MLFQNNGDMLEQSMLSLSTTPQWQGEIYAPPITVSSRHNIELHNIVSLLGNAAKNVTKRRVF